MTQNGQEWVRMGQTRSERKNSKKNRKMCIKSESSILAYVLHCRALFALVKCFQQCSRVFTSVHVLSPVIKCFQQCSGVFKPHHAPFPPSKSGPTQAVSVKNFKLSFQSPLRLFFRIHVGYRFQTPLRALSITCRCCPLPFVASFLLVASHYND